MFPNSIDIDVSDWCTTLQFNKDNNNSRFKVYEWKSTDHVPLIISNCLHKEQLFATKFVASGTQCSTIFRQVAQPLIRPLWSSKGARSIHTSYFMTKCRLILTQHRKTWKPLNHWRNTLDIFDDTKQTPMSNKPVSFIYSSELCQYTYGVFTEDLNVLCKLSLAKEWMFY